MKYILVTGGVISGLGKGITSSSIGVLLQCCNLKVTSIKIDPYLNIDAGTMSPLEHGEVYVLNDGGEVDLDLGNYERFLNISLTKAHNITTGKVYKNVISAERRGDYIGKTVQMVPHITDEVIRIIESTALISVEKDDLTQNPQHISPEVCIIELGGTIGDLESMIYLEALQQLKHRLGSNFFFHVHVTYIPFVHEHKSKPTQHSLSHLRSRGLNPDLIVCRSDEVISTVFLEKISRSCMIELKCIVNVANVKNVYMVPGILYSQDVHQRLNEALFEGRTSLDIEKIKFWDVISNFFIEPAVTDTKITIGLVGKYTSFRDSYLSIFKSIEHASFKLGIRVEVICIDSEDSHIPDCLRTLDGILVPGGFGERGIEGKIQAIRYARLHKIPYLGICLGLQLAVIEVARNTPRSGFYQLRRIYSDRK